MFSTLPLIGDIVEGKSCAMVFNDLPTLFRVEQVSGPVMFSSGNRKGQLDSFYMVLYRIQDKYTHPSTFFTAGLHNWRFVKRNGRTVCDGCHRNSL